MAVASIWKIPRNDVAACIAYYESRGQITTDEAQVMAMLQDDPAALRQAARGWRVVNDRLGDDAVMANNLIAAITNSDR